MTTLSSFQIISLSVATAAAVIGAVVALTLAWRWHP